MLTAAVWIIGLLLYWLFGVIIIAVAHTQLQNLRHQRWRIDPQNSEHLVAVSFAAWCGLRSSSPRWGQPDLSDL